MLTAMPAATVLDREFLEMRARLLELAASLDRLDRAEGSVDQDPRVKQIREALEVLKGDKAERAEQIQLIFSRAYEDDWQDRFDMPAAP